ncbi:hypothetical protein KI387_037106, partial [Taxus chinensis]
FQASRLIQGKIVKLANSCSRPPLGQLEQFITRKGADRPKKSPSGPKRKGTSRTNGREMPESAERKKICPSPLPRASRTRVRRGREPAESGKPEEFFPDNTGTFGTNGREGCEPAGSTETRNFSTRTSGTKGREGRG